MPKGARKGKSEERIKTEIATDLQYKYYIENNVDSKTSIFSIPKRLYTKIIKEVSNEIIDFLIEEGGELKLPHRTGSLKIIKYKQHLKKDESGKPILNNLPINWDATLKLWDSDKESKENKTLIRYINKNFEVFQYVYLKRKANFKNRSKYSFKPTRSNKIKLKNAIKNNNLNFFSL